MSHKHYNNWNNYTNYSNPTPAPANVAPVEAAVTPEVTEEVVNEEAAAKPEVTGEVVNEEVVTPEPPAEPIIGVVTDCVKLNVRKQPTTSAAVVTTLVLGTEVMINEEESTDEFYKVYTAAGVEGFCKKDFINTNA